MISMIPAPGRMTSAVCSMNPVDCQGRAYSGTHSSECRPSPPCVSRRLAISGNAAPPRRLGATCEIEHAWWSRTPSLSAPPVKFYRRTGPFDAGFGHTDRVEVIAVGMECWLVSPCLKGETGASGRGRLAGPRAIGRGGVFTCRTSTQSRRCAVSMRWVNEAFAAMSTWRIETAKSSEKNSEQVIEDGFRCPDVGMARGKSSMPSARKCKALPSSRSKLWIRSWTLGWSRSKHRTR
jgi:hypothetical protein